MSTTAGRGGARLGAGRPRLQLETLVREGTFSYRNARHRRALFSADPEGTFGLDVGDARLEPLRYQARIHRMYAGSSRGPAADAAKQFEATVRRSL